MRCLVLFALATMALAQQPARPKIGSTFEAMAMIRIHGREGDVNGTGRWYSDATHMRELETSELDKGKFRSYRLARFDLKKEYLIMGNSTDCEEHPLGEFHAPFGWLEEAHYEGEHSTPAGVKVQVWAARHDEFSFILGVKPETPDVPYVFEREEGKTVIGYEFTSFKAVDPPATSFNVPPECTKRQ
eukprot:scpid79924/ scgid25680/ 